MYEAEGDAVGDERNESENEGEGRERAQRISLLFSRLESSRRDSQRQRKTEDLKRPTEVERGRNESGREVKGKVDASKRGDRQRWRRKRRNQWARRPRRFEMQ